MVNGSFDVVVAGAGHNSLVSAAYLAKAGLSVVVLEARDTIGGNTTTEEATLPGFLHDTCSTAHNLIQSSPTLRRDELGLAAHGLTYLHPDPVVHMPFPDGRSLTMWRDIERTTQAIARFSTADAKTYARFIAEYEAVAPIFNAHAYTPIGFGPSLEERFAGHEKGHLWMRLNAMSAWDVIKSRFEDDHVRAFLMWMAFMTMIPPDHPGTGRLAYALLAGRQRHSWAIPRGGSIALPQALAGVIKAHGGRIEVGRRVERLRVEDGRVCGVTCSDGSRWSARRAVLSSIHIKQLADTAPEAPWPKAFTDALEHWQSGVCMFAAHYATTQPLRFVTEDGERIEPSAVGVMPSVARGLRMGSDIARDALAVDDPPLLAICSSSADQSRAPAQHHTLKVVGFHPYAIEGNPANWDAKKDAVASAHFTQLRRFQPHLTDDAVLACVVKSPLDLERQNTHNWHGSCHGGAQGPSQSDAMRPVYGWAQHRMPLKGLYQTGATTHPGGSVSAGPGRNAAWVLLSDLGIDAMPATA
ncbi:MAG: NAD(P)/FAD-dependent oxidoreductase [Devosia sp.]